jgi:succinate dehydrogenase/fumarate reductase flavoprotein subunit
MDAVWQEVRRGLVVADDLNLARVREAAAMAATARWMFYSGLSRMETRGMHRREDYPETDPQQHYRLISSGLDRITVAPHTGAAGSDFPLEVAQ